MKIIKDEHGEFLADNYYDLSAGHYCGLFMPEHVMRKMARLASDYQVEVQRLLQRHADELYASNWTVANHKENDKIVKQVTIHFVQRDASERCDVQRRISLFKAPQPTHFDRIYVVDTYFDAQPVAESILAARLADEDIGEQA